MKLLIGLFSVVMGIVLLVLACVVAAGKADERAEDMECWRYCDDDCLECFRREKCYAWRQLNEQKS